MLHSHQQKKQNYNKAFAVGVILNITFVVIEGVYGILAESLALVADAGHNLSDVIGLVLAWGASFLAAQIPTSRRTYGFRRVTILVSLLSAILLLVALGAIIWEAIGRFSNPKPVDGITIIVVAAIGVVINTVTALMFISGQKHDLNIKGAFLHMAADAGVSLGVVVAGVAILATGWLWLDPMISIVIAIIILFGTWRLLLDSVSLAIDSVPKNIDPDEVEEYLKNLPNVAEVHDLHIWAMSTTEVALTAHLIIPEISVDDAFIQNVSRDLHNKFGIDHPTLQVERGDGKFCKQAHPVSL